MTIGPKRPVSIYLIYAQKDEALKEEFDDYLVMLQQARRISGWVERQIRPGTDWSQEIDSRLLTADLIVLFVSPGLLASGYCSGAEFSKAFEMQKAGEVLIIPVLLHQVDLRGQLFASLQCLPAKSIPVSSWTERKEAWWSVYQGIRQVVEAHY